MSKINKTKFKRKSISIKDKMWILDRLNAGEKVVNISKELQMNESTIRTIRKSENKIIKAFSELHPALKKSARIRDPILQQMEDDLMTWIEDCHKKRIHLTSTMIKKEAFIIYNNLKWAKFPDHSHKKYEFNGSQGWFNRFKTKFSLDFTVKDEEQECISRSPLNIKEESCDDDVLVIKDEIEEEFSLEHLNQGLDLARHVEDFFVNMDPCLARSLEFKKKLQDCLAPYLQLQGSLSCSGETSIVSEPFYDS